MLKPFVAKKTEARVEVGLGMARPRVEVGLGMARRPQQTTLKPRIDS